MNQSIENSASQGEAGRGLLGAEAAGSDAVPVEPADVVDAGGPQAPLPVQRPRRGGLPPEGALGRGPAHPGTKVCTSLSFAIQ